MLKIGNKGDMYKYLRDYSKKLLELQKYMHTAEYTNIAKIVFL